MRKLIVLPVLTLLISLSLITCKKDNPNPGNGNSFKADTVLVHVDDNLFNNYKSGGNVRQPRSMVYDSVSKSLFFYLPAASPATGFDIVQYSLVNKNSAIVYGNTTWSNNNGSEGKNLYIANSELWVPGGANNNKIDRLNIGNFTLSLSNEYNFDNVKVNTTSIYAPYDMVQANNGNLYVATMYDNVFYGTYNNIGVPTGLFDVSRTSHGTGIKAVTSGGTQYLAVKCGEAGKIELYTLGGTFVRSVPTPVYNDPPLLKDSKDRLYYFNDDEKKMYRYSGDLLTTETFPVDSFYSYYGMGLKEDADHVTIYTGNFSNGVNGIGMVRLPQ